MLIGIRDTEKATVTPVKDFNNLNQDLASIFETLQTSYY